MKLVATSRCRSEQPLRLHEHRPEHGQAVHRAHERRRAARVRRPQAAGGHRRSRRPASTASSPCRRSIASTRPRPTARQLFTIDEQDRPRARASTAPASTPTGSSTTRSSGTSSSPTRAATSKSCSAHAAPRMARMPLGGEAGNAQYDPGAARVLVDVQDRNEMAVIDPRANRIVAPGRAAGMRHDHGLNIDAPRRLAFVACDGNARLLDARPRDDEGHAGARASASGPTCSRSTRVADGCTSRGRAGVVTVAAERGDGWRSSGRGDSPPNAHTVAVDPVTHLVYFPLESGTGGRPELRIMRAHGLGAGRKLARTVQTAFAFAPRPV